MTITTETGLVLVAAAIFAAAWVSGLTPTNIKNAVGWVISAIMVIVLGIHFIHCNG